MTASIEKAWNESSALWLETPTDRGADAKIIEEQGHSSTRTFLESLAPALRPRAEAYIAELGIDPASIQTMRPWLAYYTINGAFWTKYKQPDLVYPDQVLRERATRERKLIHSEYPTREALLKSFAAWSDELQSQWIELLLDFLDDQKAGLNDAYFGWLRGEPSTRALDRMRSKTPLLYQTIQAGRNVWWAHTIDELLGRPGVSFVLVGMNHALGPDGFRSSCSASRSRRRSTCGRCRAEAGYMTRRRTRSPMSSPTPAAGGHPHQDVGRPGLDPESDQRHRHRDAGRGPRQDLRAVLHDVISVGKVSPGPPTSPRRARRTAVVRRDTRPELRSAMS